MLYLVCCAVFLGILSGNGHIVFASPTSYDQRQTGDVNVQIHLKDVQVVALVDADLLEDYTDYDYPYDYADFTLKPIIKPSTSTITPAPTRPADVPSTTTPETSGSTATSVSIETSGSTAASGSIENSGSTATSGSTAITDSPNNIALDAATANVTADKVTASDGPAKIVEAKKNLAETSSASNLKKSCPPHYIMDKKQGRCRSMKNRRRFSLVPLNLRLGSRPVKEQQEEHPGVGTKDLPIRIYKSESIKQ